MTHDEDVPALRADRLGKRYGRVWGLRGCTFSVPPGAVVGLVGPNGAGKTTLLSLIVGLLAPTEGEIAVFGETSRAHTADTLARVSYLAQDRPLYGGFTVADMFHFGRSMNPRWDQTLAQARVDALGIPLQRKVKALSGGQQAQVALAKRAPLLALDEPVASLDPVARLEFMRDVMATAAGTGLTVIIASHVISELERLCDWLLVLTGGRLQLAGPVDGLLAAHQVLTVPLGLVTGGLVVFGAAVTAVMAWFHEPLDRVTSRLQPAPFNAEGLTFTTSLLCAFGLAVLAGLLLRNTIGAMVTAYIAWEIPSAAVLLLNGPIRIPAPAIMRIPCRAGCPGAAVSTVPPVTGHLGDFVLSVARSGGELVVTYLPASRYWTEQFIQGGLFLAIAVTALSVAVWLLHRRTT